MSAFQLWRLGMARIVDPIGIIALAWLGWQVIFGGSQEFYAHATWIGAIAIAGCVIDPGVRRNVPVPLLLYLAAMLAAEAGGSAAGGDFRLGAGRPLYSYAVMVAFIFGVAYLLRTPRRLAWFAIALVAAITVIGMQLMFDRYETNFPDPRQTSGWAYQPSVTQWGGLHQSGMLLILALPFVLAPIVVARRLSLIAAASIFSIALVAAAYINASRGGVVAMAGVIVGMVFCAVWMRVRDWRVRALSVALLVLPLLLAVAVITGRTPIPKPESASGGRIPIWSAALAMFRDHPWLGVGPGHYQTVIVSGGYGARYDPDPSGLRQAHNLLLQVAVETGVVGLAAYSAWWAWMLFATFRHWRNDHVAMVSVGLTFALAGFLIRSMTDNFMDGIPTTDRTRVLVWALWAAALAVQRLPRHVDA